MSIVRCDVCEAFIDSDQFPECFDYHDGKCLCERHKYHFVDANNMVE